MKLTLKGFMDAIEKLDKNHFVGIKINDEEAIVDIDIEQSYHPGLRANVVLITGAMVLPKGVVIEVVEGVEKTDVESSIDADPSSSFLSALSGRGKSKDSIGGQGLGDFKPTGDSSSTAG